MFTKTPSVHTKISCRCFTVLRWAYFLLLLISMGGDRGEAASEAKTHCGLLIVLCGVCVFKQMFLGDNIGERICVRPASVATPAQCFNIVVRPLPHVPSRRWTTCQHVQAMMLPVRAKYVLFCALRLLISTKREIKCNASQFVRSYRD